MKIVRAGLGALIMVAACGGADGGAGAPDGGGNGNGGGDGSGGGGGNGACLFPCDNPWYTDVTGTAVAPDSQSIIDSIGEWGSGKFRIDFSITFMHADASTPRHTFTVDYTDDSDTDPVPVPVGGALEGETGYTCEGGGDCHLLVIDDSTHKLFELWSVSNANGPYVAEEEAVWDLTKHYGPDGRGLGCTSADAAGLAIVPGLIGLRETRAGVIAHALRFILPNAKIRSGPSYVAPATHGTSATTSSSGPPYGSRLRLKPSFDESQIASAGGKAVVRALKKYGMLLADGGNIALTGESDSLERKQDPTMTWDGVLDSNDLNAIQPTDFEVLEHGDLRQGYDCVLNK